MAVEMRILAGSDILLAPEFGNRWGTCSIEMATTDSTPEDQWLRFCQELIDIWASYRDARNQPLRLRPHWAKQWSQFTVRGQPIAEYLKQINQDNWSEFQRQLASIAKDGRFHVADLSMFANPTLDNLGLIPRVTG